MRCPHCNSLMTRASGPQDADILIIGEFPGEDEMQTGRAFTGTTGKVLRNEMRQVGLEFAMCRVTNIWLHTPTKNEDCLKFGMNAVLDEAKDRKAILLIGSECSNTFVGKGVMEIAGLEVTSPLLFADLIMACPNPAIVFHPNQGVGEVKLSLKKFADACKKRGLND